MPDDPPAIALDDVTVMAGGRPIVDRVSWTVRPGERWVVLGPNGCGKTTLLMIAGAQRLPSRGRAHVLGQRLGRTDMRALRGRIGFAGVSVGASLRQDIRVLDAVMAARYGALETWWHTYTAADEEAARRVLAASRADEFGDRPLDSLSQGERQRVLVARAFLAAEGLVILDEPAAGLDFVSREQLVAQVDTLAREPRRATILVTHHVEEIPPAATHALLMRDGRAVAQGDIETVLTETALADCLGLPVRLERRGGRWSAWAER